MFVILNHGRFVAKPGRKSSYCRRIEDAQTFKTREEAERNKCGNESIQDLNAVIRGILGNSIRG